MVRHSISMSTSPSPAFPSCHPMPCRIKVSWLVRGLILPLIYWGYDWFESLRDKYRPGWGQDLAVLGLSWAEHKLSTKRHRCQKASVKMGVLTISYWAGNVPSVVPMWSSTWAEVAPKRVQVGAKLRHLGAKLGRSWSQVGPFRAQVGALLAQVGPKLSPCCGHVGSKRWLWSRGVDPEMPQLKTGHPLDRLLKL